MRTSTEWMAWFGIASRRKQLFLRYSKNPASAGFFYGRFWPKADLQFRQISMIGMTALGETGDWVLGHRKTCSETSAMRPKADIGLNLD